jgi:hypothetical protein
MYVKKFNETSPIANSTSHEITIIKPDTIRTIIIDYAQKAKAVLMQIAYAINQVVNHRAVVRDIIMRLLEKITHDAVDAFGNNDTKIADNLVGGSINHAIIALINHSIEAELKVKNKSDNREASEDVKGDNKKSKGVDAKFIVEAERTSDDDNSPHTINSAIDLAESESARNREQNTLPPNVV